MAYKCNCRLFTKKCISTKLSLKFFVNTFISFSTTRMITLSTWKWDYCCERLLTVALSLTEAGCRKIFCVPCHFYHRLMKNSLIQMEYSDWLNTIQGIHCVFVTELSLTWSSSCSLKASQLQCSLYRSLEGLKGWKATTFAISMTIDSAHLYFFWKY